MAVLQHNQHWNGGCKGDWGETLKRRIRESKSVSKINGLPFFPPIHGSVGRARARPRGGSGGGGWGGGGRGDRGYPFWIKNQTQTGLKAESPHAQGQAPDQANLNGPKLKGKHKTKSWAPRPKELSAKRLGCQIKDICILIISATPTNWKRLGFRVQGCLGLVLEAVGREHQSQTRTNSKP